MKKIFQFIFLNKSLIYKSILYLSTAFLLIYLFPKEAKFKYEFNKGTTWSNDALYAPFDFPIIKSEFSKLLILKIG